MTATQDFFTPAVKGDSTPYPITTGAVIYAGSFVNVITATGYAVPATDASGRVCVGIATKYASYANGDTEVEVVGVGTYLVKGAGTIAITDEGAMAYIYQDDTIKTSGVTNYVAVGFVTKFVDTTHCWVRLQCPNPTATTAASVSIADAGSIITGTNVETALQEIQNHRGGTTSRVLQVLECWYDFATHGGVAGAIAATLRGAATAFTVPDNFVMTDIAYEVEIALTSAGAATLKIGTTGSDAHIAAQQAFDNAIYVVDYVAKAATLKKIATADSVLFTVGTADLTAGRINVYITGFQGV